MLVTESKERSQLMETFYVQIEDLKTSLQTIPAATQNMQAITEQVLLAGLSSAQEQELDTHVRSVMSQTRQQALRIQTKLGELQKETETLTKKLTPSDLRIRTSLGSALAHKLVEELRLYQSAQQCYKVTTQDKLHRQIRLVVPAEATDDDVIDALIRNGHDRDSLYQTAVLQGSSSIHPTIRSVHDRVANKHDAIVDIEHNVAMVHQLFLDLALLTEQQGALLDRIDVHMKQAVEYVETGNEELCEAHTLRKKWRKKRRFLILIAGAVTLVVVVVFIL